MSKKIMSYHITKISTAGHCGWKSISWSIVKPYDCLSICDEWYHALFTPWGTEQNYVSIQGSYTFWCFCFIFIVFLISFFITMDAATILTTFFPQLQFDRKNGWLKQICCINKDSLSQSRFKLPARICLSWYFYQVPLITTRCRYCYPFLPLYWWSLCLPRSARSSYVGFDFGWLLFLRYSQTSNISRIESQKMWLEQRRQAMLQLNLSDQEFYCLIKCVLR